MSEEVEHVVLAGDDHLWDVCKELDPRHLAKFREWLSRIEEQEKLKDQEDGKWESLVETDRETPEGSG